MNLAHFLQAVGSFRPIEEADDEAGEKDRMHRLTVVFRVAQRLSPTSVGGTGGNDHKIGNGGLGERRLIGRRDFHLSQYKTRLCEGRAKDYYRDPFPLKPAIGPHDPLMEALSQKTIDEYFGTKEELAA